MRKSKNDVEVRSVNDFRPAFVDPEFFGEGLTVGTVTVAAGIIVDLGMPAVLADTDVTAKCVGFAAHQGISGFALDVGLAATTLAVLVIGKTENLLDGKISQSAHPLTGQKD